MERFLVAKIFVLCSSSNTSGVCAQGTLYEVFTHSQAYPYVDYAQSNSITAWLPVHVLCCPIRVWGAHMPYGSTADSIEHRPL